MVVFPPILDWPLFQAPHKINVWLEKKIEDSLKLYLVSPVVKEVSISLPNSDKRFYSRHFFTPYCAKPVKVLFPTLSPPSVPQRTSKDFFPYCKRNQTWPSLPYIETLISNMWLAPSCRLSQPFQKTANS